jgi:hypothetical protein
MDRYCTINTTEHATEIRNRANKYDLDRGFAVRMWINQPSTSQPLHHLHGTNVLALRENDDTCRIYFLSGDVISQQAPRLSLSSGWTK